MSPIQIPEPEIDPKREEELYRLIGRGFPVNIDIRGHLSSDNWSNKLSQNGERDSHTSLPGKGKHLSISVIQQYLGRWDA